MFAFIFVVAFLAILIIAFSGAAISASSSGLESNKKRSKVKKLKLAILERDDIIEEQKNVIAQQEIELTAYRNDLPWVHVKEIDGTQE